MSNDIVGTCLVYLYFVFRYRALPVYRFARNNVNNRITVTNVVRYANAPTDYVIMLQENASVPQATEAKSVTSPALSAFTV